MPSLMSLDGQFEEAIAIATYGQWEPYHLYLLRHAFRPWLKVGITRNVKKRMVTYYTAWGVQPFMPTAVHAATLLLMRATGREVEAHILKHFDRDRVSGEWLRLTPEVRAMERASSLLHEDTPVGYREAILPFADAIGWKRLRFPREAPAPEPAKPYVYYRGVSPKV
jgi:hypothetical protein